MVLIPMLYQRQLNAVKRMGWIILRILSFVLYWIALNFPTESALLGSLYFYGIALIGGLLFYDLYLKQEKRLVPSGAEMAVPGQSVLSSSAPLEVSWK